MSNTEQQILDLELELELEKYFHSGKAATDELNEWNSDAFCQWVWDNIQRGRFRPRNFVETVSRPIVKTVSRPITSLRDTAQI